MRAIRHRISDVLLELLRRVYPGEQPQARVWQIIEVPRRITKTEAEQLAAQVENL